MGGPEIPESIAGWPVEIRRFPMPGGALEMLAVADLEHLVDRDRLLNDESFEPPYWALIWSGSVRLARWMSRSTDLSGLRLLDVGCGLGVVSLAAARAGALVTAVDREAVPLEFLRSSAARNGTPLEAIEGSFPEALGGRTFDVVVAAELLYEVSNFSTLAQGLARCLSPGGRLLMADATRVDTAPFFEALEETGVQLVSEQQEQCREETTSIRVRLLEFGPG
jgi:2-polyprenyl-3-methyl-5-hydroxy-6-metoxy-1,4-benzoquinol methylase